jgi:hypothetical protein
VAILLPLARAVTFPVSITYLTGPPGAGEYGGPKLLFDLRVDIAVAAFLLRAQVSGAYPIARANPTTISPSAITPNVLRKPLTPCTASS